MLTKTLDEMALGGIHDHLAGGFHRYSTEPSWSVPHFEKMLYDNAQLLPLYARAFKATKRPLYKRVAEDIARYLALEMTNPQGGLYSAQDAEVNAVEGESYVWTEAEIREVLGEEAATDFLSVYQLVPVHRSSTSPGALRLRLPISTALARLKLPDAVALQDRYAASRKALLARRATRDQPLRDDKVAMAYGRQLGKPGTSKFSEIQDLRRAFGPDRQLLRPPRIFANNANSAIRKELWAQHSFDESLPGLEDIEWAQHWGHQGYAVALNRTQQAVHLPLVDQQLTRPAGFVIGFTG